VARTELPLTAERAPPNATLNLLRDAPSEDPSACLYAVISTGSLDSGGSVQCQHVLVVAQHDENRVADSLPLLILSRAMGMITYDATMGRIQTMM
jgi:hypothetical protein